MIIILAAASVTVAFVAGATLIEQKDRRRSDESYAYRMAQRYSR